MASAKITQPGLIYRKLDLHLHTPASKDFNGEATPQDIVDEAIRKGLTGIAITDHNTGEWVDKVKEAARGKDLVVFPGVEISCNGGKDGIHLIALFDPDKDTAHVQGVLSALGIPPSHQGKPDSLVDKKALIEIIELIQSDEWGGIAVLAHVNSNKGVLHDMSGEQRTRVIQHPSLLAVEATDYENEGARVKKKRAFDLLDGSDPVYKRKLAVYQASDNPFEGGSGHCLTSIGSRCSYFKMEKVNLDSLRQCFYDPDVRIKQDFEFQHSVAFPHIKSIKIKGGFLDGQDVYFHSGLNSIIGAKGTGKSLLIELLRFGLGQPPSHANIYQDHIGKLDNRFGEYGIVEIVFTDETNNDHVIERTYRIGGDGTFNIAYDPAITCQVLFLSQNEIIKIAEDEQKQLNFIDAFFDFQTYKAKLSKLEQSLAIYDRQMAEGIRAIPEVSHLNTEIESLKVEIAKLDTELNSPIFQKYTLAKQKQQIFVAQSQIIQNMRDTAKGLKDKTERIDIPDLPQDLKNDPALRRNQDSIAQAKKAIEEQLAAADKAVASLIRKIDQEQQKWNPVYQQDLEQYTNHVREAGGDYQALATLREKKTRRLEELKAQLAVEVKKKNSTTDISKKRDELLDELEKVYADYTEERRSKCEKFQQDSAGRLELQILGSSNSDEFRRRLLQLKQGSFLRENEIETICEKTKPRDFILTLLRYSAASAGGKSNPQTQLRDLAKVASIPLERMAKLADFLTNAIDPEQLLALQYKAYPQDRPEIKFNIGEGHFEPLNAVSIGQKSTALLIMALSNGTMPIVIDQPEDSLDIKSIWEDICMKIRDGKEARQFIFTTHNSSVAVASDSDYFIILDGTATVGKVVHCGSMDHQPISEEVLTYLEGGVETYRRKYAKYKGDQKLKT